MRKTDFQKIRPLKNFVAIIPDEEIGKKIYELESGIILMKDWQPQEHAVITGVVANITGLQYSKKIIQRHGGGGAALEFDTVCQLAPGDKVYLRHNALVNAFNANRVYRHGDEKMDGIYDVEKKGSPKYCCIVYYDEILFKYDDDYNITALNGYLFLKQIPVFGNKVNWIDLPDGFKPVYEEKKATVLATPQHVGEYFWDHTRGLTGYGYGPSEDKLKPGDVVYFSSAQKFENAVAKKTNKYDDVLITIEPEIVAVERNGKKLINKNHVGVTLKPVLEKSKHLHTTGLILDSTGKKVSTLENKKLYRYHVGRVMFKHESHPWSVGDHLLFRRGTPAVDIGNGVAAINVRDIIAITEGVEVIS